MSTKIKSKFNIKKAYIITFAIIAIVSTIALAGTPPTFQSISWTSILSGESRPENGRTISTSRGEKVHDFVNTRKTYGTTFSLAKNLIIEKDLRVGLDDYRNHTLYLYGDIQLSTAPILSNANNGNECNTGNVGRIRLKMPQTGTTACPLMICYPGTQSGAPSGVSRKSACENVVIPSGSIRNQVGVMTGTIATN